MRRAIVLLGVIASVLMVVPASVVAHHSAAMFDTTTEMTLQGSVVEWQWRNPHCTLRMDVKGADGAVKTWSVATANIADLSKRGWSRRTFNVGDTVTAIIRPARSGEPVGMIEFVTLPNGQKLR